MVDLPLPRGSDPGRYEELSRQRLINCYYEPKDKKTGTIFFVAGMTRYFPVSAGLYRGGIECDGIIYGVWSDGAYKIAADGTVVFLGYITGSKRVSLAKNGARFAPRSQADVAPIFTATGQYVLQAGTGFYGVSGTGPATTAQIGIVSDAGDYYVIENDTLELMGDSSLPKWIDICEINGYFVLAAEDGRFFNTGINDAKNISGLDVDEAGGKRDRNVAITSHRLELYIFGDESCEVWRDEANAVGSPFGRLPGAVLPKGCKRGAKHTLREADNSLVFVANDNTVCRTEGYQPKVVSNFAVERDIENETDPTNLEADVWSENGHTMYALTGTNFTWVLDFATGEWHERKSYKSSKWKGRGVIRAFNKNLVGSRDDGYLYDLAINSRKEGDDPVPCIIRIPSFNLFPDNAEYYNIHIWAVTGRAPLTGAANDVSPRVTLRWSDDGKVMHGVRHLSLGATGRPNIALKANQLGSNKYKIPRTWELEFTDDHVVAVDRVAVNA